MSRGTDNLKKVFKKTKFLIDKHYKICYNDKEEKEKSKFQNFLKKIKKCLTGIARCDTI